MFAFLMGPTFKVLAAGALALSFMVFVSAFFRQHDARVVAERAIAERDAMIIAMKADHDRTVATLQDRAAKASDDDAQTKSILAEIANAPAMSGCKYPTAVNGVLGVLRKAAPASR